MKNAKEHFQQNIERVKNLAKIYAAIDTQETLSLELNDILRAEYVMLVSALDYFIHEVVRIGMLDIYQNKRKTTKPFEEFILSTDRKILLKKAIMEEKSNQWLDYQIRFRNGFKSFQQADKIENAIALIKNISLWDEVANILNEDAKDLQKRLNFIIERRNQIAHEADIEPTYQELRNIESTDVNDSIIFIEELVNAIYLVCRLPEG